MVNALITGMGQVIGIGILKALRMSQFDCVYIGTDCEPQSAGLYMVDKPYLVPRALTDRQGYLRRMAAICRREKVRIVFPGSEAEVLVFSSVAADFSKETGTVVVVSPAAVVERTTDKWENTRFLSAHGFPVPATIIPTSVNVDDFTGSYGFPMVVKPRRGSASKGIQVVKNRGELLFYLSNREDVILQEYLQPDDQEYTVGVFVTTSGRSIDAIVLRRELSGGLTFRAKVVYDGEMTVLCRRVAEKCGIAGPCNVQLRRTNRGPVIFEVNPRFSSTVAIRAHFGYNEPAMAVENFVFNKIPSRPEIGAGSALRYWEEKYIETSGGVQSGQSDN